MEAVRDAWTDERLDDLNSRVGQLSRRMDEGFREVREEFRAVRGEMAAMHRSLVQLIIGSFATTMVGFAGTIATILIQG
jgi:hypothetical protein